MTTDEDVLGRLRSFVRSHFKVAPEDRDFSDDVHLFDFGYVDSFGAVELIQHVESEFGVQITDRDLVLHPLNTIREIAAFVSARRTGK